MDLPVLYRRDLSRLLRQIEAYPDDGALWRALPGVTNSAGNIILHIEGNLREYIGRQLGSVPYVRRRDREFTLTGLSKEELMSGIDELRHLIPLTLENISPEKMKSQYPEVVLGKPLSTEDFLIHLYGHLNWHLGQIDTLRRALTGNGAISPINL
jgi:hypothetical protein